MNDKRTVYFLHIKLPSVFLNDFFFLKTVSFLFFIFFCGRRRSTAVEKEASEKREEPEKVKSHHVAVLR